MMLGVCSWAFAGAARGTRSLEDLAALAAAAGFASLEATYPLRGGAALAALDPAVPIVSLATLQFHRVHFTDPRPARRAVALETLRGMIECAARRGIASISFSPGPPWQGRTFAETLDLLAQEVRPILAKALREGVRVSLENVPGHCLATRDTMAAALDATGATLCLDLGNTLVDPPTIAWIERFRSVIEKIHLSDGQSGAGGLHAMLPGEGEVPWHSVRHAIESIAFAGPILVEAPLPQGTCEAEFLQALRAAAGRCWDG